MFKYRTTEPDNDPGSLITQPNQAFTVRQIIDQFARGELIPTQYNPTDSLGDDVDDDYVDDVVEFEDRLDAEAHLKMNQYQLFKDETISDQKSSSTEEVRESSNTTPDQAND